MKICVIIFFTFVGTPINIKWHLKWSRYLCLNDDYFLSDILLFFTKYEQKKLHTCMKCSLFALPYYSAT